MLDGWSSDEVVGVLVMVEGSNGGLATTMDIIEIINKKKAFVKVNIEIRQTNCWWSLSCDR